MTSADLLLHPVRLRIVQAFLGDRALTTSELRSELPEVPAASLYRHVARLLGAGVLAVVAEQRVRGAFERTYVLAKGDVDLVRDGVTYRLNGIWLDDGELAELLREISDIFQSRLANGPQPGRKRRILAGAFLPGSDADGS